MVENTCCIHHFVHDTKKCPSDSEANSELSYSEASASEFLENPEDMLLQCSCTVMSFATSNLQLHNSLFPVTHYSHTFRYNFSYLMFFHVVAMVMTIIIIINSPISNAVYWDSQKYYQYQSLASLYADEWWFNWHKGCISWIIIPIWTWILKQYLIWYSYHGGGPGYSWIYLDCEWNPGQINPLRGNFKQIVSQHSNNWAVQLLFG